MNRKDLIVRIICDKEVGTAFYVAPDLLLTAWHTVASYKESGKNIVKDAEGDLRFFVNSVYENVDLAVLTVKDRKSKDRLSLLSHRIKIGEKFVSYGYPDITKEDGLRIQGRITQRIAFSTGDFKLRTEDVDDTFDYQGMSGAPIIQAENVIGFVIEQDGGNLNIVSVGKFAEILKEETLVIEKEASLTDLPNTIAMNVETAQPNYSVYEAIDGSVADRNNRWILLHGTPGCGKTTISASYQPNDKSFVILGRFFFKVPNDYLSRAIRCSEGFFVDWLESVFISITGTEIEALTTEEKRKRIPTWFQNVGNFLAQRKQKGLLLIDGLDELATDSGNRVDEILSLIPDSLPDNITIILSCITEEIIPANIVGKIQKDGKIEVTALDIAACELFIKDNSGSWEKPYPFIQAVAQKTEGHPLYMNYLCRYIIDTFDSTTKEDLLNEWVESLPSIGGNIHSYYEAIWKKADPKGSVYEIIAILSQTRGAVEESQLIEMMKIPNAYVFKSSIKEFRHLLKEQDMDRYEIYHSSFRLFVAEKMRSILKLINDQIASYCEAHDDTLYAIENYLHHVVNGKDTKKGLTLCNQEWADRCALHNISPDLVMHDIKECLSYAVDFGLSIEVIRLMLLAQRIENRCDSIMVDNVSSFVDLNIALGKPDVALKYIVRDNILLVSLPDAMKYLHLLIEIGFKDQASILKDTIEAEIRKSISETSKKGTSPYVFAAKGFLIVEGILSGVEDPNDLERYFDTLTQIKEGLDEDSVETLGQVVDIIIAYQLSNQLRTGTVINIEKSIKRYKVTWNETLVMIFIKALAFYEEKDFGLHRIGHNEAFVNCIHQIENVLLNHTFVFSENDLKILLAELADKPIDSGIIKNLLMQYGPKIENFVFRKDNGVDIDTNSLLNFYRESMYQAYIDDKMACPAVNKNYYTDTSWEKYVESLISRTSYISGSLYRKRAAKEDYTSYYVLVKETVDSIDFSFETRSFWKRSYLLPEELVPFVYDKLAEIYCEFFEDRIGDFKAHLQSRMSSQLGLYREGYCATLIKLTSIFRKYGQIKGIALYFADEVVKYIMYAVQNRSERCSYLLQICLEYALLNEKEKANSVYQEVLNSSMGPEWYKEGQLGLINALTEIDIIFDRNRAAHLAAIFEEASGEMTFQRYVQQNKNQFTGTLVKSASLADAIAYYKFETLPPAEVIVHNAEDWKVDMPTKGNGYDLGANHLIESSAICYLLRKSKLVSPYIRYAVSELFWENWDKMHNDLNFAKLHAEIINTIGEQAAKDVLLPRMAIYFTNTYYADKKGDYLKDLEGTFVPGTLLNYFQKYLKENGFIWNRKTNIHKTTRQKDSYSEKMNKLPNCKAMLDELRKDIISPLGSYWHMLDQILIPLANKPDFDKKQLLDVIISHFDINVHPSEEQFEKFNMFVGKHEEKDSDEQMIHFLIWFLVHPERKVVERAKESLTWLVKLDNRVIDCLIKEILDSSEIGLATASSAMLLEISKKMPDIVLKHIEKGEIQKQLGMLANFSVSRNLYEIALSLSEKCSHKQFLDIMKSIIPDVLPDRGDVILDNMEMLLFEHKIDKLNNLKVTGGQEFARPYLFALKEMGGKDKMLMLINADRYAARSFYMTDWNEGRYNRTMSEILNRVLYSKVDIKRANLVYYIINN